MRYFLDFEFIEDGRTIDPLSLGVVCEDGREFYAENADADLSRANEWVNTNVLPHLWHRQTDKRDANLWSRDGGSGGFWTLDLIASEVRRFVSAGDDRPEFWGYYADYDWVALCQLYGRMVDLPEGWPMFCMDLKQLAVFLGNPELPKQDGTEHHALADARWNRDTFDWLAEYSIANNYGVRFVTGAG